MNAVSNGQKENMTCCAENGNSTNSKECPSVTEEELLSKPYITPEDVLGLQHITESKSEYLDTTKILNHSSIVYTYEL